MTNKKNSINKKKGGGIQLLNSQYVSKSPYFFKIKKMIDNEKLLKD